MGQQHSYQGLRIGTGAGAGNFEASTMLQSTSAFNYAGNFAGFQDPQYTQLVLAATTEPDAVRRKQTLFPIERLPPGPKLHLRLCLVSVHRAHLVEGPRTAIQRFGRAQLRRCLVGLVTEGPTADLVWRASVKLGSSCWREHQQPVSGRVAIVTGGGHGIGRAYCQGLANHGADVVIAEIDEDAAHKTAADLMELNQDHDVLAISTDVSNPQSVEHMVAALSCGPPNRPRRSG